MVSNSKIVLGGAQFGMDYGSTNTSKKIKQIGNAVPPPLIEMIVKELVK